MISFTSLDLQKQTGDVQRAAAQGPVLITAHGKPRNVMLSVEEFSRLKSAAGEAVPGELHIKRAVTVRASDDPLGYDVSDIRAAARQMVEDARTGQTEAAVRTELAKVRRLFARRAR